uniref:ATP synthase F0 subunit 8 n=1 Tax=Microchironomus tener TaxID=1278990 RepID=UPI0022A6DC40|nr:ATP synthase F0 subunit 8 [Microchironomus tener]UZS77067.1 ATP synthase F0 subunit 8 [Microchironomus tener]
MPQMSPMSWTILFIMFTLIFLFFNILNYFNFIPSFKPSTEDKTTSSYSNPTLTWKW